MKKPLITLCSIGGGGPGGGWTAELDMCALGKRFRITQSSGEYFRRSMVKRTNPAWHVLARFLVRQDEDWLIPEECAVTVRGVTDWQAAVLAVCWTRMDDFRAGAALLQVPLILLAAPMIVNGRSGKESSGKLLRDLYQNLDARLNALGMGRALGQILPKVAKSIAASEEPDDLVRILEIVEGRAETFENEWDGPLQLFLRQVDEPKVERVIAGCRRLFLAKGVLPQSGCTRVAGAAVDFTELRSISSMLKAEDTALATCNHRFALAVYGKDISICTNCGAVRGPRQTFGYRVIYSARAALETLGIDSSRLMQEMKNGGST